MGVQVHVPADAVWEFFQTNRKRLNDEMVLIAENTDTEYAVYLTAENDLPVLAAAKGDGKTEYKETCVSNEDCVMVVRKFFTRYLFPVVIKNDKYIPDNAPKDDKADATETWMDVEDAMYERDDELRLALMDFLGVTLKIGDEDDVEAAELCDVDIIDEILDEFLKMLADEYGFEIYRPMMVTSNDGYEVFTEFPYNEYDLEIEGHTTEDAEEETTDE